MLGVVYLLLCFGVGWAICSYAFPDLPEHTRKTYDRKSINLSPYALLIPAWFITGTLATTWSVYLVASLAFRSGSPLAVANAIVMPTALCFFAAVFYDKKFRKNAKVGLLSDDTTTNVKEFILFGLILLLAFILMWSTFYAEDGRLYIGVSVFSDFSPHIGMIRSFSYGNNFPTAYSHYAGEDIRYHFMFQFLSGNLEFLGMRIDYAFNVPSMISFLSAFMLLYVLAVKITGRFLAGALACLFFAFRSSKALLTFLSNLPEGESIWEALWENTGFIGDTTHEDWGLWNLNVYCNQRHFAFGLSAMFFVLILFLPLLYETFGENSKNSLTFKNIFFAKEGWEIKNIRYPVALGILLGSLSFFHGSAVIGSLLVLFVTAILSKRRLEFLITAVITVLLSTVQTGYFIEGPAVSPKLLFGFIAERRTFFGVISYLDRLLGILPVVLFAAFLIAGWAKKYIMIAFLAPFVFAFSVSLTVDVTVNHKYIMMSCILMGIFAAFLITRMFDRKEIVWSIAAGLLVFMLTATGIYDFITVLRKNSTEGKIILNMDDPLTEFVRNNSDSKDIFLTPPYTINQLVFGGAMLFQGHQYYAWSAGYDTAYRDIMVKRMYETKTPEELDMLVKENNIRFIVVEQANRESPEYDLNEDNIRATYECVYETGEGERKFSIFDTRKKLIN